MGLEMEFIENEQIEDDTEYFSPNKKTDKATEKILKEL